MYFVYPFGVANAPAPIPTTAAPAVLSYQYGFGVDFELPFPSNPSALPIPRDQFNQLMRDITTEIQQYQQYGTPAWITAVENLGVSFPYPIYARVYYGGIVYENQVVNNVATPGTDNTWMVISGAFDGIQTGTVLEYGGVTPPAGYLLCDGNNTRSRVTYANLFAAITFIQSGTTDGVTGVITALSDTSQMYVGEYLEGAGIPASSVIVSIDSGTQVTINNPTTLASTSPLTFFPFGAGSTGSNFAVPNRIDYVSAGARGTLLASLGKSGIGLKGGTVNQTLVADNLPAHTHLADPSSGGQFLMSGSGNPPPSNYSAGTQTTHISTNTGDNSTLNLPVPIIQPTLLMTFIIKT